MDKTFNKIMIIIAVVLSVLLLSLNLTLALMADKKINTGIIQFKEHKLDVKIVGKNSVILAPEELTLGSNSTRTINITNPSTSTNCVFRIWMEFLVDEKVDEEYLTFNITDNDFSKSESNKFYYNQVLSSGTSKNNLVLRFKVNTNVPSSYQGKNYTLKLNIESIQASKVAVEEWSDDYLVDWYTNIKNQLS